jgi:hypothetical protein
MRTPLRIVLLCVALAGCTGGSTTTSTSGGTTTSTTGIAGPSTSSSSVSEEDLAQRLNPALASFRASFQRYLRAYTSYYSLNLAGMSWADASSLMANRQAAPEEQLVLLAAKQQELVPLVDAAIQHNIIPEVVSGSASDQDIRRYFQLFGRWIESNQQGFKQTDSCLDMPQAIGGACMTAFYGSSDFRRGVQLTKELNKLQVKLFGG